MRPLRNMRWHRGHRGRFQPAQRLITILRNRSRRHFRTESGKVSGSKIDYSRQGKSQYLMGAAMPYYVKWLPSGKTWRVSDDVHYSEPSEAMDFACVVLLRNPDDLWVDDEHGTIIADLAKIRARCKQRGLLG
jgi:hypothetical protein